MDAFVYLSLTLIITIVPPVSKPLIAPQVLQFPSFVGQFLIQLYLLMFQTQVTPVTPLEDYAYYRVALKQITFAISHACFELIQKFTFIQSYKTKLIVRKHRYSSYSILMVEFGV